MEGNERDLRLRIEALERELRAARAAQSKAEGELAGEIKADRHIHHASENMRAYGHSDGVIFLEPQKPSGDIPEECVRNVRKMTGLYGKLARVCIKYNIDQFATRPVLHQWLQNGKVFREAEERQASKFELFFDLLFVGIIHQISDAAAEQPDGIGFAKYILTFCPAYAIWTDVRDTVNQFGSDDVTQRLYILWIMLLLVGYSNNASSIEVGMSTASETLDISQLAMLDAEASARGRAIQWALGFFVVAKLSKVLLNLVYGFFLPLSRKPLLASSFNSAFASMLFFLAIFLSLDVQIILVAVGIVGELLIKLVGVAIIKYVEVRGIGRMRTIPVQVASEEHSSTSEENKEEGSRTEKMPDKPSARSRYESFLEFNKKTLRLPAINIEHHVDRLGAFVTIVLGEMVANIFFKNSIAVGLNREAGRSFLALMLAFNLNWLYFDSEACRQFIHALRRHWFTSSVFTYIHLPLVMALLLASSAINKMVVNDDVETGLKFFFGSGIGITVICMSTIGTLHKSLDKHRSAIGFSRWLILTVRYATGLLMVFLPFAHAKLNSIQYLGIYVGVTGFVIGEEIVGRLEERRQGPSPDD